MYVKHNGDVYPCCQSYMLDGAPVGRIGEQSLEEIWNSDEMQRMRRLHVSGRAGEIDICARCCATIPHPVLVAGSLLFNGKVVRRMIPFVERIAGRFLRAPESESATARRRAGADPGWFRTGQRAAGVAVISSQDIA